MKKTSEYRQHAAECRSLAAGMLAEEHREQLLAMASTWDHMAEERERNLLAAGVVLVDRGEAEARA